MRKYFIMVIIVILMYVMFDIIGYVPSSTMAFLLGIPCAFLGLIIDKQLN